MNDDIARLASGFFNNLLTLSMDILVGGTTRPVGFDSRKRGMRAMRLEDGVDRFGYTRERQTVGQERRHRLLLWEIVIASPRAR